MLWLLAVVVPGARATHDDDDNDVHTWASVWFWVLVATLIVCLVIACLGVAWRRRQVYFVRNDKGQIIGYNETVTTSDSKMTPSRKLPTKLKWTTDISRVNATPFV